jgi:predicted SnoaL-like aldol condensation-catalyzing enzyme
MNRKNKIDFIKSAFQESKKNNANVFSIKIGKENEYCIDGKRVTESYFSETLKCIPKESLKISVNIVD